MRNPDVQKVLLINPPGKVFVLSDGTPSSRKHCFPPLGLAYLAANLRRNGYEVRVIDMLAEGYHQETFKPPFIHFGLNKEELLDRIERDRPDLVGISLMFSQKINEVDEICSAIKKKYPQVPIVLGGPHPSGAPLEVMQNPDIDFVMSREADISFVSLLESLNGRLALSEVPSLYYRENHEVKRTRPDAVPAVTGVGWEHYYKKDAGIPLDLDQLPFPAWDLFPMNAYWKADVRLAGSDVIREKYAVMVSSRGCPHACDFCASPLVSGYKGYRERSDESVMQEIRWLIDEFGVQEVLFNDDNFFINKPRTKRLMEKLGKTFPDVFFSAPGGTEANALDFEMIDLMAENNFYRINIAVEAGDQAVQDASVDKKVQVSRLPELISYLRSKNIETRAMYMIGFPGETRAQIQRTIDLVKSLEVDDFYIAIVTPVRGTVLFDECVRNNLFIDDYDVNNITFSTAKLKLPDITPEELEKLRRNVWLEAFNQRRQKVSSLVDKASKRFSDAHEYEMAGYSVLGKTQHDRHQH